MLCAEEFSFSLLGRRAPLGPRFPWARTSHIDRFYKSTQREWANGIRPATLSASWKKKKPKLRGTQRHKNRRDCVAEYLNAKSMVMLISDRPANQFDLASYGRFAYN